MKTVDFFSEACITGKHHRSSFGCSQHKSGVPGELVHSDVCGPMQEPSISGARYFVLFKDDCTHYRYVFFMKQKSEVSGFIDVFIKSVSRDTNFSVQVIRSDNGLEYVNKEVDSMLLAHGVRHQTTVPYSPEQNGSAERDMRTIVEAARTMIHAKGLHLSFWAEAVQAAIFVLNRTGSSPVQGVSPYELWFKKKTGSGYVEGVRCRSVCSCA